MKRASLVDGRARVGVDRLGEARFLLVCLLPWACLVAAWRRGRGLAAGVLVLELERCSTRMLSEPILPAAWLTREAPRATSAFTPRPVPTRTDQMVEVAYDQERGEPSVQGSVQTSPGGSAGQ